MTTDQHNTNREALTRELAAVPPSEVRKLLARFEAEIRTDQRLRDAQILETRAAELLDACLTEMRTAPHTYAIEATLRAGAGLIRAGGAR